MKILLAAALLFLGTIDLQAQAPSDSLRLLLKQSRHDSLRAGLHWDLGVALRREGKVEEAIEAYREALRLAEVSRQHAVAARSYNSLGLIWVMKGEYEQALESYLRSLQLHEQLNDRNGQLKNYINLGNFFAMQQAFDKAAEHYQTALALLEPGQDLRNEALLNLNLGGINGDPDNPSGNRSEALVYFEKAKKGFIELGDSLSLAGIHNNIGVLHEQQGNLGAAYSSHRQALEIRQRLGDAAGLAQSYDNLGNVERQRKAYRQAIGYFAQSLQTARTVGALHQVQRALLNLSLAHAELGDHRKAYDFRLRYDGLKDSLFTEEKSRQLAELATRYETEKKDRELLVKEASIRQKTAERNTTMITLGITILLSLAMMVFYQQRRRAMAQLALKNEELHNHRIAELLREQEIRAIHAMLEGQDRERRRIAEDLHDRLGSTLSAVKLHLGALDGTALHPTAKPLYQNLNGLLDQAVTEVRDIAHNMTSGVLTKFGLAAALQDLKQSLEASRQLKIELIISNLDERLEGQTEITLYRIIQELVSNILKHAGASDITLQLNKIGNELLLMVEDNGRGYDPLQPGEKKGMGLRNVESRVASLGGRLSIDSGKGRGTTTTIEIPLP